MENNKCAYCGGNANFQLKNGKYCCCEYYNSCPDNRKKTSEKQKGDKNHRFGKRPWNKGLTKDIDERVLKYTESMKLTKRNNPKKAWNEGLTKETDSRVAQYAIKVSKAKKGKPNYKLRKPINKSRAKTIGKFRHLFKKGLYTYWIFPIMKRDEFKCTICGKTKIRLEVHHLIPYREIFPTCCEKMGLKVLDWEKWSENDIQKLEQLILNHHTMEMGITVCEKCHSKIDKYRKIFNSFNKANNEDNCN